MDFDNPPPDPIAELNRWLEQAKQIALFTPEAMTLATVDPDGRPSARMVLLKGLDEHGAVFYTNRASRKAKAIEANPFATLVFYWDALHRQVGIEGRVSVVADAESDAYFATRPREAQLGAWASRQSEMIESRAALDRCVEEMEQRFEGRPVPRPPQWGGYRVSLERIEFWQGRPQRLHDRVVYIRQADGGWQTQRLCP